MQSTGTKSSSTLDTTTLRVAVVDPSQSQPMVVKQLFAAGSWCRCAYVEPGDLAKHAHDDYDIIVCVDNESNKKEHFQKLSEWRIKLLIVITDRQLTFNDLSMAHVCLPMDCSVELLQGAILGLMAARRELAKADVEQSHMRRVSEGVQKHVNAMDAELRLASRLQLDFLPRGNLTFGSSQFTTLYRPCSWVSGDIFDVFQLDEDHVGFYLADAMGHGVAAGLLTMYVKNAIDAQRFVVGENLAREPGKTLTKLNDRLVGEALNDCRFVTCWYGLLNIRTLELNYSVAGHPPAIWISRDGQIKELLGEGGLLGLESGHTFTERSVQLVEGDRIVLYSDGLDDVLIADRRPFPQMPEWRGGIPTLLAATASELLSGLEQRLDRLPGSLNKADDVSVIVLDVGH